jgi:hypothetical protein
MKRIFKHGKLLPLPVVPEPHSTDLKYWRIYNTIDKYWFKERLWKEDLAAYNQWLESGISVSDELKLVEGKEYEEGKDFKSVKFCEHLNNKCSDDKINQLCTCYKSVMINPFAIPIEQVEGVPNWDDIIERYCKLIHFELGEVRYVIIPLLNWLKENYKAPSPLTKEDVPGERK